jgi:hypothetical protein
METTLPRRRLQEGSPGTVLWRAAQIIGLASTVALIAGLLVIPEPTLSVLWNVAIPLLPASFVVNPALWRNVCPLATLNMLPNGFVARRTITVRQIPSVGAAGILLLIILVPARRFLFNTDGVALAIVISAIAVMALILGAIFDAKAGFCNAVCPVLPVERLYGQHPLVVVRNPRCTPCTLCTVRGCIDLAPTKSAAQTLGRARRSHRWLFSAYGALAAAFPGFIVGYYLVEDVRFADAADVYLTIGAWAVGSYLLTSALVRGLHLGASTVLTALAALSVGLYYWFAAPLIAGTLGIGGAGVVAIWATVAGLLVVWLLRAGNARTTNSQFGAAGESRV